MTPIEIDAYMQGFAKKLIGGKVAGHLTVEMNSHEYPALKIETPDGKVQLVAAVRGKVDERPGCFCGWKEELAGSTILRGGCVELEHYDFPSLHLISPNGKEFYVAPWRAQTDQRPGFFMYCASLAASGCDK